ncbi:MAG: hypothetical protein AAF546_09675 [Verrucomicrobiota bacterium]
MKLRLLVFLSAVNLLSAAELRIYKEERTAVPFGEIPEVSFPLVAKSELSEHEYDILKIIAELQTFAEPGLVHPFIGDIYYLAVFEKGKQVGQLIQFAHVKDLRSGNIYLHEWEADENELKAKKGDAVTHIPLYSKELGDILTEHLLDSGILNKQESNHNSE